MGEVSDRGLLLLSQDGEADGDVRDHEQAHLRPAARVDDGLELIKELADLSRADVAEGHRVTSPRGRQ
jgi:hypothetical protein